MPLMRFLARQAQDPRGWFGKLVMTRFFDRGNAPLLDHMIDLLQVQPTDHILDIGCAGGSVVRRLAAAADAGRVVGFDRSPDMIAHARRDLREVIAAGRAEIVQGDVAAMPFAAGAFSKVCTANTLYFWADAPRVAGELRRVLAPGGTLVVAYRSRAQLADKPFVQHGFTLYDPAEVEDLLRAAGLRDVRTESRPVQRNFDTYCTVATQPA